MLDILKAIVEWILDPPWQSSNGDPLTLAVPDARSTFNRGASGLANRPAAEVQCPSCAKQFMHHRGLDMIRCPRCPVERPSERLGDFELLDVVCPNCGGSMDYGIRHPHLFDSPQWMACPKCQFHWESNHDFDTRRVS